MAKKVDINKIERVEKSKHPKFLDLTNYVFNKLTVREYFGRIRLPKGDSKHYWLCDCQCGNTTVVRTNDLRSGGVTSCGCFHSEIMIELKTTHNITGTNEYNIWLGIKARCYNKNSNEYHNYGGRGIKMCDEWINDPVKFCEDIGKRPSKNHSIDRIDNDGNYCPENCRWATRKEQANNKRNNKFVEFNDKIMTISQWSDEVNISTSIISRRLISGWTEEEALTIEPVMGYKRKKI